MTDVLRITRFALSSWQYLALPWAVLAAAFALTLALAWSTGDTFTTGGLMTIVVFAAVIGSQVVLEWWPLAAALGATRGRTFAAALLLGAGFAALTGAVVGGFGALERATGGWGVDLTFFAMGVERLGGAPAQVLLVAALSALLWAVGMLGAAAHKRWGTVGLVVMVGAALVLPFAAFALLGSGGVLDDVIAWLDRLPLLALVAGAPGVLAALAAAGAWGVLRRTAP